MRRTLLLAATLVLVGCRGPSDTRRGDTTTPARDTASATGPLQDPQILVLASTINASEIGSAQTALPKLGDRSVRAFAEQMIAEHVAMDSALTVGLPVKKEQATRPPPQFVTMRAASAAQGAMLATMPARPAYDRAFVAVQVSAHTMAVDSLTLWSQAARDGSLRDALRETVGRVQVHLARARALQTALGGTATDTAPPPPPDTSQQRVEDVQGNVEKSRVTDTTSTLPRPAGAPPQTPAPRGVRPQDAAPITPAAPARVAPGRPDTTRRP
jgi:putative membrane protein